MPLNTRRLNPEQLMIGSLIRELRQTMNLSQGRFAEVLGMTFPTINRWENGHSVPSPLALKQIDLVLQQLGDRGEALRAKYGSEDEQ